MPMHRQNSGIGTKECRDRTVTKEIDVTGVGDDMEAELSMYGLLITRITRFNLRRRYRVEGERG
jgi:hypothetical protein